MIVMVNRYYVLDGETGGGMGDPRRWWTNPERYETKEEAEEVRKKLMAGGWVEYYVREVCEEVPYARV